MAAQSEIPPAVADTDDNISSPAVAAASSASGSCDWGQLESSRCGDLVSLVSGNTTISEDQSITLPNNMDARSLASPLPGGTSEPKETTAEPIAAESEMSASVGKAAGASSAVAEVTPPAVEESSNQTDLPEQRAARPAPGSAAKAPPPNPMWQDFVPDENPWPAGEAMIPPQNCKAPPTYVQLTQLKDRMEDPNDPETKQNTSYTNVMMKWWRDGAQGYDPRKWANPDVQKLDFSLTDKHRIGSIIRVGNRNYEWRRNMPHDIKYVLGVDMSIHKMLAHPYVLDVMLKDGNGQTYDVYSLHLECLEPGTSWDHVRQLNLRQAGKYPLKGQMLPMWEWVLVRNVDRKRFRFSVQNDGETWKIFQWPWGEPIRWNQFAWGEPIPGMLSLIHI